MAQNHEEGRLLQQLTKRPLESALEGEITDHLGDDKHDPAGSFEPVIVRERKRRLPGVARSGTSTTGHRRPTVGSRLTLGRG